MTTIAFSGKTPRRRRLPRGAIGLGLVLASCFALSACAEPDPGTFKDRATMADANGTTASSGGVPYVESAAGDFLIGNFAVDNGDVHAAATAFGRALQRNPQDLDLRRRVFLLAMASGEMEVALDQARTIVDIDSEADEERLFLALDTARGGDFAGALAQLETIQRSGVVGVVLPVVEAWAAFGSGDVEGALEFLRDDGDEKGTAPLNDYHSGMILVLAGRPTEAVDLLRAAAPSETDAPMRIVEALGAALYQSGDKAAARALFDANLAVHPGNPGLELLLETIDDGEAPPLPVTTPIEGMGDAMLGTAEALDQQRASGRGIIFARMATFVDPQLAEGWLLLGDIFLGQDNAEEAIKAYAHVPADDPLAWEARLKSSRAFYIDERPDEAEDLLRTMAAERPTRTDALVELADMLRRQEDYAAAEIVYGDVLARIATVDRRHWRLFYARGITRERTQRWPEAEVDFLKALELAPEQPFVLNYLGYSWVDKGLHLDDARDMLRRAVELRPNDGFIVDSMGWVHYRLGEYADAVAQLERAVEIEPGDPVINDHLGDAYWRIGRLREARFQWQRALTLDPEDDAIAGIEAKLTSGLPSDALVKTNG